MKKRNRSRSFILYFSIWVTDRFSRNTFPNLHPHCLLEKLMVLIYKAINNLQKNHWQIYFRILVSMVFFPLDCLFCKWYVSSASVLLPFCNLRYCFIAPCFTRIAPKDVLIIWLSNLYNYEGTWWRLFHKRFVCSKLNPMFYNYHWIDISAGKLLVAKSIILPVVVASALTWFIKYIYVLWNVLNIM